MKERITPEQLTKIVAEVERLSNQRDKEIERQQVKEILEELNLPVDLLDEAMIQLQRKETLAIQKKRNLLISLGVAVVIIGTIITTSIFLQNRQASLANIVAYQSFLTLSQNQGENLTIIERGQSPEIYYRVTLKQVPLGQKLSLKCDWLDPLGNIAHQNKYQTRTIDKEVWNTFCRYQFTSNSLEGNWKVQMKLGDKVLSDTSFVVK